MNRIYTTDEINVLVKKYKRGNHPEASLELFKAFEGYLIKYAHFIKYGSIKSTDKDLISLSCLLNINKDKNNAVMYIFETWEFQDIFNELYLLFLKCVNRFVKRDNGPSFVGFLYNYFKYTVKDWISYISKDALNNLNIEEFDGATIQQDCSFSYNTEYDNICLSSRVILSQEEKYILHLHYGVKMSLKGIAKLLGISRSSVTSIRDKAIAKLKESGVILENLEKRYNDNL